MKNKILIGGGLLLIAAALFLTMNNMVESWRAGKTASGMLIQIERLESTRAEEAGADKVGASSDGTEQTETDQSGSTNAMPVLSVDGLDCIGTITIPSLKLTLPVLNDWNYELLKSAPCRFSGSVQDNDLVIAGHNYRTHFQKIKWMKQGESVVFTDLNGKEYHYEVVSVDEIDGDDVEGMLAGDWDLILFTYTTSRVARAAVRCKRI